MKAFAIFPIICIFLLTLTLLSLGGQAKHRTALLWSVLVTGLLGGLLIWFSVDVFPFLYYLNFIGVFICIPCLTYLTNRVVSKTQPGRVNWIRLLGIGIVSTVVTIVVAGFLIFMSFLFNPMDPPLNNQTQEPVTQ